jgi:hypothetical protein
MASISREMVANDRHYLGIGPAPKWNCDRFPDASGNYEPGNVRWATNSQQMQNRRHSESEAFPGYSADLLASLAVANVTSLTLRYPAG